MSGTFQKAPFSLENAEATKILKPMRFVDVDIVAGTTEYATTGATTKAVTLGTVGEDVGEVMAVRSLKEINYISVVIAGETIAAGDEVSAVGGTDGVAMVDVSTGVAIALHAAVVNQHLSIIPKGAF